MNIERLFSLQEALDRKIETQHGLQNENLVEKKILALLVEVGELANETKCFKFWSLKPSAPIDVILEEYVDGVHFILSLGLELGIAPEQFELRDIQGEISLTEQFLNVFAAINIYKDNQSVSTYIKLFNQYIYLGQLLGFTNEQVEMAYFSKNEVNHERQKQGY